MGLLQELFKPLLGALGLESVQMSAVMKELGGALSLRGGLSALRINIVDSDFGSSGMNVSGRRSDSARGKVRVFFDLSFFCHLCCFVISKQLFDDADA